MAKNLNGKWCVQVSTIRLGASGRTVCFQENWLVTTEGYEDIPTVGSNTRQRRLRLSGFDDATVERLASYITTGNQDGAALVLSEMLTVAGGAQ